MADRPTPYVKRTAGDIIRADEWNEVQIRAQEDIAAHNHTGGFGAPLPRDAIQNKAIDASKLDPDSRYAMKELTVGGPLKVTGTAQLAEIRAALASFSGAKLTTSGDVGVGTATPTARLEVSTQNDRGWDGNKSSLRIVSPDTRYFLDVKSFVVASGNVGYQFSPTGETGTATGLSLDTNGNLGIGIARPGARLDVEGGALLGYASSLNAGGLPGDFGMPLKSGFYQNGGAELTGDVPDGTHPWTHLIVCRHSNTTNNYQLQIGASYAENDRLFFRKMASGSLTTAQNSAWNELATRGANTFAGSQAITGNVTITGNLGTNGFPPTPKTRGWGGGIHTWDVEAEGSMWSKNGVQTGARDLAENFATLEAIEPGDVVSLTADGSGVERCRQPHDPLVLGVVSTEPGMLLGADALQHERIAGEQPIALAGRVPCKVCAENGPIRKGNLLVPASLPGHAMRAGDNTTGCTIGKALADFDGDTGLIDVFVFLR
ncbi:hypothetical protein [Zoogloea sp. 1C4]|uniref:hypothetical protein n=1 Tax=Zoogloea sp. 1C4 TaxID=2570190 RepID=UPI00129287C3|nr:hypothetical protein [Zoogloea sp. 1C4]